MTDHREAGGIVTFTPAGAIDATYRVRLLERGAFTRAADYEREVSGKGVNVAAALDRAGRVVAAVVVLGEDDRTFAAASPHASLLRVVGVPGATRVNTSIVDDGGATTKVNAPTPPLAQSGWDAATDAVRVALAEVRARWLVISGTVPEITSGGHADLGPVIAHARASGARVALDTSGAALARLAAAPGDFGLLKPNTHELAELAGRPLRTVGEVAAAARTLVDRGAEIVFTSMGADGVLVVSRSTIVAARATAHTVVNTAGAGDASLAGFLVGLGDADPGDGEALARAAGSAAAWGAHAVAQSSTIVPGLTGMPTASIETEPDPARTLTEPAC